MLQILKKMEMIERPFIAIDRNKMMKNLEMMHRKAISSGCKFVPHLKTHHSASLLSYYYELGITEFTVSSVQMAEYFVDNGVQKLTIAFPSDVSKIENLNQMASKAEISIFIDSVEAVQILADSIFNPIGIYIEIDNGYKRSGVDSSDIELIFEIIRTIKNVERLSFIGLAIHDGLTYKAKNADEIRAIHEESHKKITALKKSIQIEFGINSVISMGDSPTMSLINNFEGIDEIRPGVFIFNDLQQYFLGVCKMEEIATYLISTVISKYPQRGEILLHSGAIHLSKDYAKDSSGKVIYGISARVNSKFEIEQIYEQSYIRQLSQEHGVLVAEKELFDAVEIGDTIAILPAHICLTCALATEYYCDGEILCKLR
ncbi:MAG: alanine racemase [Candidatus Kapabacteria bacterium]|nr:alanine racemase [Candidatus Kapabacteria bacterium]